MAENSPAESRRAEHARCQLLSLNLMPLSPPPSPVESNLAERQKRAPVTATSTAVCFQLGGGTLPASVSLLHKAPQLPPPQSSSPPCAPKSVGVTVNPTSQRCRDVTPQPCVPSGTEARQVFQTWQFFLWVLQAPGSFSKIPSGSFGILFFFSILH